MQVGVPVSGSKWERCRWAAWMCGGSKEVAGPGFTRPLLPFSAKEGERHLNQTEFWVSPYCVWRLFVVHLLLICIFMIKPTAVQCLEDLE